MCPGYDRDSSSTSNGRHGDSIAPRLTTKRRGCHSKSGCQFTRGCQCRRVHMGCARSYGRTHGMLHCYEKSIQRYGNALQTRAVPRRRSVRRDRHDWTRYFLQGSDQSQHPTYNSVQGFHHLQQCAVPQPLCRFTLLPRSDEQHAGGLRAYPLPRWHPLYRRHRYAHIGSDDRALACAAIARGQACVGRCVRTTWRVARVPSCYAFLLHTPARHSLHLQHDEDLPRLRRGLA